MTLPLDTIWGDPVFYSFAALLAASMFALIYSISRWLELKNEALYQDDLPPLPAEFAAEAPPARQADLAQAGAQEAPAPEQNDLSQPAAVEIAAPEGIDGLGSQAEAGAFSAQAGTDDISVLPEGAPEAAAAPQDDLAAWINELPEDELRVDPDKTVVVPNIQELIDQAAREAAETPLQGQDAPGCVPEPVPAVNSAAAPGGAEQYVKGIFEHLSGMNARLSAIEETVAGGSGGARRKFTIKFLEGLLEDYDSLSKDKLRARVNYLLTDLKENLRENLERRGR